MMNTPILQKLIEHAHDQPVSLHVPGHKNGELAEGDYGRFFEQVMKLDVTELPGFDDLHAPSECIYEAEQLAAEQYGIARTRFLVGGSTVGNLAMLLAFCNRGDTVFVQRDSHQSIVHGLELAGVQAVFLRSDLDEQTDLSRGIGRATLASAYKAYPNARALVMTSPSYYGSVGELEAVVNLAKSYGLSVLVDEAHGAHLHIDSTFPRSALELGADAVVQSAHKTLPALTMGAYLHLRSLKDEWKINGWLKRLQTSSPSYIIMASLDAARAYARTMKQRKPARALSRFHSKVHTKIPGASVSTEDPLKLLMYVPEGYTGSNWEKEFHRQGVYPELSNEQFVLLILPIQMSESYEHELLHVLGELYDEQTLPKKKQRFTPDYPETSMISFESIGETATEYIHLDQAVGRTIAEEVVPYPPGIPLWIVGERIDESRLVFLLEWCKSGGRVQGGNQLQNDELLVVKEEVTYE
ncbi:arginine decarboxylase [Geomicrobium sp. JCM 19037]|uniref:aminotransferase class I/II-fold pyridoxal phosphate-dependent enzyme n=1 Tax=Geomicrobium sp. JCM 19037 TaxID=1460634 RepID=UPI00045F3A99|nr:aminotransferase class I/II-fold pyridoxal phosphate-dependent enzyme [Geomicrobium sp. JCM 19037]GAK04843.1 arginine decarboxylase [Geomicrobium sp. JCM 19037]